MGRITEALKKVADERVERVQKKPEFHYVAKKVEGTSIEEHVVAFHDPMSLVSEQYNILRTNIQRLRHVKNYKTFLITSSIDTEGKTITSTNLALAMARDVNNLSVLLIDADMRKGRVSKYMGLPAEPGLSDLLKGEVDLKEVVLDPGIENLSVIPAGRVPKNPSELLNSKKMKDLLGAFKTKYDYVLIDTPPVMPLTDACILGPMVDAAVLVVQAGRTQRDMVRNSEKRLMQAGVNVAGFVMTQIEHHLPNYLSRYTQQYDSYYTCYADQK